MSNDAMELADRYNIDEKKLRYVVAMSPEHHTELVRQIVDLKLTSKQVKEICETTFGQINETSQDEDSISQAALRIARATRNSADLSGEDLARALMRQEGDVSLARARLQMMHRLLEDAEGHLPTQ